MFSHFLYHPPYSTQLPWACYVSSLWFHSEQPREIFSWSERAELEFDSQVLARLQHTYDGEATPGLRVRSPVFYFTFCSSIQRLCGSEEVGFPFWLRFLHL
jgi:hypothetical protein